MVEDGLSTSLSCPSPSPWLLCTWRTTQRLLCALLTDGGVRLVDCEGEEPVTLPTTQHEVTVVGDPARCDLHLPRVSPLLAGVWTCSLSSLQSGRLVSSHTGKVSLMVLSRGRFSLLLQDQQLVSHRILFTQSTVRGRRS